MKTVARSSKKDFDDLFDDDSDDHREVISFGLPTVDPPLGDGLPTGVLVEAFGPTGSGKTSLGYSHLAEHQKLGNICVLFDAERSWNPSMGARYGIDTNHVNAKGEKTFRKSSKSEIKVIETLFARIKTMLYNFPEIRFIMVDSLAALSTRAATEKKESDQTNTDAMDRAARLSFYIRELDRWIADTGNNTTVYIVNHEKELIGIGGYGPPKTDTGGGKALKFYSSIRLQFRIVKTEKIKVFDPVTKQEISKEDKIYIRVTAVKNRFHKPFQPATFIFDVGGGTGIDRVRTALAHAYAQKAITNVKGRIAIPAKFTAGSEDVNLYGADKAAAYFEENPEAFAKLESHVVKNLSASGEQRMDEDDSEDNDGLIDLNDLT